MHLRSNGNVFNRLYYTNAANRYKHFCDLNDVKRRTFYRYNVIVCFVCILSLMMVLQYTETGLLMNFDYDKLHSMPDSKIFASFRILPGTSLIITLHCPGWLRLALAGTGRALVGS